MCNKACGTEKRSDWEIDVGRSFRQVRNVKSVDILSPNTMQNVIQQKYSRA